MQGELLNGLAEGGPILLPFLVRGAVKAVKIFCSKVKSHLRPRYRPMRLCHGSPVREDTALLSSVRFVCV